MAKKLTEEEIKKRLIKLNNYEKIKHPKLKERSAKLREENKKLKDYISKIPDFEKQIETQKLRIEELESMKFGKKRRNLKFLSKKLPSGIQETKRIKRIRESYKRRDPELTEVTNILELKIEKCPECGEILSDKKEHIHYREDLKEAKRMISEAKKVVKTIIESGICKTKECEFFGKKFTASEIPTNKVVIGENVRRMIVFQNILQGQSYSEIQKSLKNLYNFKISSGQITNILEGESRLLTPYYNFLIEKLDEESKTIGAHYDETSFKTKSQGKEISDGNYCWVKISAKSEHQLIWFGKSRGKKVAESLRGKRKNSIGITDDYGSYHDLFDFHQLCWAHPHRKFRDLAESSKIEGKVKKCCEKMYKDFRNLYKRSDKFRKEILRGSLSKKKIEVESKNLEKIFDEISVDSDVDPEKLRTLKKTLRLNKSKYFTFFDFPEIPLDNNKAERAIRKIVIRRKKSLGCKSPKGADVLSILYSVIFSLMGISPELNFFDIYDFAANFEDSHYLL